MVSLIVPIYNCEKYINRCIDCILSQTEPHIQLIVINDGSTDSTKELLLKREQEIKEKLTDYVYFEQKNSGVGAAVREGLKRVKGNYICLYDNDDILLPDSIITQREWLDSHTDCAMVRTNGVYTFENGTQPDKLLSDAKESKYFKEHYEIFEDLFYGRGYPYPGTYMFRTQAYRDIYQENEIFPSRYGQNSQLLMPIAYKFKVGYIDEVLMKYTIRMGSFSHPTQKGKALANLIGFHEIGKETIKVIFSGGGSEKITL